MSDPIKILAIVQFNKGEAYVLNHSPEYVYERDGNILWAHDTGFYSVYAYDRPSERWQAFAGRKFDLPLKDGGVEHCHGQWWDGGQAKLSEKLGITLESVTIETISGLQKCYVFCGSSIESEYREKLRTEYTGCVYPYYEYEKIISYDDMRSKLWDKNSKLEKAKKSLIREVRKFHGLVQGKEHSIHTPEQYQALTGKPWPEDGAVYYRITPDSEWEVDTYLYYLERVKPVYTDNSVLCAIGMPPKVGEVVEWEG